MKLYLLSQEVNNGYDTYDSCVVAAKNAEAAVLIPPDEHYADLHDCRRSWATVEHIKCELIGTAVRGTEAGVICSSFNAG